MMMPGRKYEAGSGYRYGFNGKENDSEHSEGVQDYGMRVYDSRIGRFFSEDPINDEYPELTPYQFSSNSPIQFIDIDGLEGYPYTLPWIKPLLEHPVSREVFEKVKEFLKPFRKTPPLPLKNPPGAVPPRPIPVPIPIPIPLPIPSPNPGKPVYGDQNSKPGNTPQPVVIPGDGPGTKNKPNDNNKPESGEKPLLGPSLRPGGTLMRTEDDDDDTYLFRGGAFTDLTFTPRPGKDDGEDNKSGLSTFMNPISATQGNGGKVQVLSTKKLRKMGFVLNVEGSHVGIRPKSQRALKIWAASRPGLAEGKPSHILTKLLKKARVREINTPRTKR